MRIYFAKTQDPEIQSMLPQSAFTVEQALENYRKTLLPGAASYGRTIYVDERYVGDIWCYCIDPADAPNAMVSYCIFEKDCWGCGIASNALKNFLLEIIPKFHLYSIGAFTYADNFPSVRVLQKNGFAVLEGFTEDGVASLYLEKNTEDMI